MTDLKLAIVIHAEEEFDWDLGFYRSNTDVTHDNHLIEVMDEIIRLGGKVTLAMDYPFVTSEGGKRVIEYYRDLSGDKVEFATHLHPWVNPPHEDNQDMVNSEFSYPGNLPRDLEYKKLEVLTDKIEEISGSRPKTYLAGRYGIGANTQEILTSLGYDLDLSISAYCDFTHQQGPDFSGYTNKSFVENGLTYQPHTCSVISLFPAVSNYLNKRPGMFTRLQGNKVARIAGKFLRIRRYRLSPEGFTFKQMKQTTESQVRVGQREFVMSFHSPSAKSGLTPYVNSEADVQSFINTISDYLKWFNGAMGGMSVLARELSFFEEDKDDK